jgi:(4-O-methyl)-D-glucuronate---lignin esterase
MVSAQIIGRLDARVGLIYSFTLIVLVAASSWAFKDNIHAAQREHADAWPDSLVLENGAPVHSQAEFEHKRRGEIIHLFEENVYGRTPTVTMPVHILQSETDERALHGLARRKQITLAVGPHGERTWHLLQYMPAHATGPVPVIIGLNFEGNQSVDLDPGIHLNPVWVPDPALKDLPLAKELAGHVKRTADMSTRGSHTSQWQVEKIVERGYGLATIYAGDIEPDFNGGIGYGIRPLFFSSSQSMPAANDWGAIGAWAWGMSRIIDVLSNDTAVDSKKFIAFGFSRFGKTALWAAAQDKRFALVLSNESGQAGATLSHRERGEPIDHLMAAFPYWFCGNYQHYLGRAQDLPLDGHLLLALIAPRPLYVGSAIDDPFSDPEGEFLAAKAVAQVYALYGERGIVDRTMPALEHSIGDVVAYHVRSGGHDVTAYDWEQYLNFADRQLGHVATELGGRVLLEKRMKNNPYRDLSAAP